MELKPNSITITYLSKVSFASLNGADKEVDNINPIKKVTLANEEQLPYVSSQAIRRALRDQLSSLGWTISNIQEASAKKGAPKTMMNPVEFIDDDLFGYMDASPGKDGEKGKSNIRISPIRVESLLGMSAYKGDLDYATNFMGKGHKTSSGEDIQPNIFETEIHSGFYKGTILVELDRVGAGQGFEEDGELKGEEKAKRVLGLLDAFQNLWSSGRQSRFLADISPKFIAAAYMKAKNPIFLESVQVEEGNKVNIKQLNQVAKDYGRFVEDYTLAGQSAIFSNGEEMSSLSEGFSKIRDWVSNHYNS
ncbi:type I-B CRISPR-associated protein Cas7/Cst2/DevR [Algoriphagus pacificus]|uniref:Type I-B CRISPR-associated protein Cas7/Cst2/DevR n=1 Tax=Algoriphagus pacificus TaxID=2811234 RepID=A0ABS3CLV4_9BACT|nr:type I-B CRISPR-associated protein Cas7/Cst2/DevR [Algoriphagus pacificus]MBN7818082.1 type I-B CRISPR-associated protein Cas7/Cst2/DevR [Algoriphagus pacificus]